MIKHAILIAIIAIFAGVVVFVTGKLSQDAGSVFGLLGTKAQCGAHCLVR